MCRTCRKLAARMEPEGWLLPDSKLERVRWELSKEERLVYAATSKEERLWMPCSSSIVEQSAPFPGSEFRMHPEQSPYSEFMIW